MILLRSFIIVFVFGFAYLQASTCLAQQNYNQLGDVLKHAYEHNPTLRAARTELKAVNEELPLAHSGFKPTITAGGNVTSADVDGSNFGGGGTTSKEVSLDLSQPLFRGGRTIAASDEAQAKIYAQRALLKALEQDVMLSAATAFMDVIRDNAILDLSKKNQTLLGQELEATKERFEVGELTRTDVAQSQARFAAAQSDTIRAQGNLDASKAIYEQLVSLPAGELITPVLDFAIPATLEESISLGAKNNPSLMAAKHIHQSAEKNVDEVFGELLPEMSLFGSWNRQYDPQPGLLKESTDKSIGVMASIPLYQAGSVRSRVRQAKHTANQRYVEILEARLDVRAKTISNWENLKASKAEIDSRSSQVEAAKVALEGVRAENTYGSRTVLDVLDAEKEYLDARVARVSAERDQVVAEFALAATLGLIDPKSFGAKDFEEELIRHLDTIQWKILGIDVDIEGANP